MTSGQINILNLEEWKRKYRPIANPFEPGINFFRGGGEEEEFVASQDPRYVWSDGWDFYKEQFVLINEYIPSDPMESKYEKTNDEIYFVCEVEGKPNDLVTYQQIEDLTITMDTTVENG
jgi:hypothetical protein